MAHYGVLQQYRFSDDVDDIRGASLYGANDDKLGKIKDVIFDHATGTIQYAVVDTGGWLSTKEFLVPAERIYTYPKDDDDFAIDATKEQIEALPRYDEDAMKNDREWNTYDRSYREAWGGGPVLNKEGSTHAITPETSELPAGRGSGVGDEQYAPQRMAGKFPDAGNDPSKTRMRPASAAKPEDGRFPGVTTPQEKPIATSQPHAQRSDAYQQFDELGAVDPVESQRDHLTDPHEVYASHNSRARWSAFEDNLRRNRVDITAACRSCDPAKDKVA